MSLTSRKKNYKIENPRTHNIHHITTTTSKYEFLKQHRRAFREQEEQVVFFVGEHHRERSAELYLQPDRIYGPGRLDLVQRFHLRRPRGHRPISLDREQLFVCKGNG